jgi:hypothetical protein
MAARVIRTGLVAAIAVLILCDVPVKTAAASGFAPAPFTGRNATVVKPRHTCIHDRIRTRARAHLTTRQKPGHRNAASIGTTNISTGHILPPYVTEAVTAPLPAAVFNHAASPRYVLLRHLAILCLHMPHFAHLQRRDAFCC